MVSPHPAEKQQEFHCRHVVESVGQVEATAALVLIWEKMAGGGIVEEATGKKAGCG
jgi:hypothetical protein